SRLHMLAATLSSFSFLNRTAPPDLYSLSLHDALPIFVKPSAVFVCQPTLDRYRFPIAPDVIATGGGAPSIAAAYTSARPTVKVRSEEHTSELQSLTNLVCRLLLEKKKNNSKPSTATRE